MTEQEGDPSEPVAATESIPSRPTAIHRPTVRVLLLDEQQRILLFSSIDDQTGLPFWYPAGGGVETGESAHETVRRELREETGLQVTTAGPEVWRRRTTATWGGRTYDCHERYFVLNVAHFEPDTNGFTSAEQDSIVRHRWWTMAELSSTPDRLVPDDLTARLDDLFTDGPPAEPIDITIN